MEVTENEVDSRLRIGSGNISVLSRAQRNMTDNWDKISQAHANSDICSGDKDRLVSSQDRHRRPLRRSRSLSLTRVGVKNMCALRDWPRVNVPAKQRAQNEQWVFTAYIMLLIAVSNRRCGRNWRANWTPWSTHYLLTTPIWKRSI